MFRAVLASLFLASCAAASPGADKALFRSESGFSVSYPGSWIRIGTTNGIGPSSSRLEISSSAERVQGVGAPRGAAEISVAMVEGEDLERRAAALAAGVVFEEQPLSSGVVKGRHGRCEPLREAVSRSEVGLGAYQIVTRFLCVQGADRFLVQLNSWEGDPQAGTWRAVALEVAAGIAAAGAEAVTEAQAAGLLRAQLASTGAAPRLRFALDSFSDATNPGFYFFAATADNGPEASVAIGNFAVDKRTGDIWDAAACEEQRSPALAGAQRQLRQSIGLDENDYGRLRRPGPSC